jgi:hypothetical protein
VDTMLPKDLRSPTRTMWARRCGRPPPSVHRVWS